MAQGTLGATSALGGWESIMRALVPARSIHSLSVVGCWDGWGFPVCSATRRSSLCGSVVPA